METDVPQTAMNKSKLVEVVPFTCLCLLANIDMSDLS